MFKKLVDFKSHDPKNPFRCGICNKYFSPKKPFYSWTSYGDCTMLEPPDPEFAHKDCYENYDRKNLLMSTSWIKPHLIS